MAISQQYLQPYQGGQNTYMPQGAQGVGGGYNQSLFGGYNPDPYKRQKPQSGLNSFLFGTPENYQQLPRFTPQGQNTLEQLLSGGIDQVNKPYEGYEPIEQETMQKFWQEILPGIKEQFAGQGGRTSSPDFLGQLGSSAKGLAGILASQKARYGLENRQQGLQRTQLGLTDPFNTQYRERQPGFFERGLQGSQDAAASIAKILPFLL